MLRHYGIRQEIVDALLIEQQIYRFFENKEIMHMNNNNVKKIMITVNGKPVGNGLVIDKVTYAPVGRTEESRSEASRAATTVMG